MSIIKLGSGHFEPSRGTMTVKVGGPLLVFFKTDDCKGCEHFGPVLAKIAQTVRQCQYAIVNLTEHREIINMSRETRYPIQSVPLLYFFFDGYLRAKYNGKRNVSAVTTFIIKVLADVSTPSTTPTRSNQVRPTDFRNQPGRNQPHSQVTPPRIGRGAPQPDIATCDPDDEDCLLTPPGVIPHNRPWKSETQHGFD